VLPKIKLDPFGVACGLMMATAPFLPWVFIDANIRGVAYRGHFNLPAVISYVDRLPKQLLELPYISNYLPLDAEAIRTLCVIVTVLLVGAGVVALFKPIAGGAVGFVGMGVSTVVGGNLFQSISYRSPSYPYYSISLTTSPSLGFYMGWIGVILCFIKYFYPQLSALFHKPGPTPHPQPTRMKEALRRFDPIWILALKSGILFGFTAVFLYGISTALLFLLASSMLGTSFFLVSVLCALLSGLVVGHRIGRRICRPSLDSRALGAVIVQTVSIAVLIFSLCCLWLWRSFPVEPLRNHVVELLTFYVLCFSFSCLSSRIAFRVALRQLITGRKVLSAFIIVLLIGIVLYGFASSALGYVYAAGGTVLVLHERQVLRYIGNNTKEVSIYWVTPQNSSWTSSVVLKIDPEPIGRSADEYGNTVYRINVTVSPGELVTVEGWYRVVVYETSGALLPLLGTGRRVADVPPDLRDHYSGPTYYWNYTDKSVAQLIEHLRISAGNDVYRLAEVARDWITTHIAYKVIRERLGAAKTLQLRYGRCLDYVDLFVALMRGLGVPANGYHGIVIEQTGLLTGETFRSWGRHAWAEFYLPHSGWTPVEVTLDPSMLPKVPIGNLKGWSTIAYIWFIGGVWHTNQRFYIPFYRECEHRNQFDNEELAETAYTIDFNPVPWEYYDTPHLVPTVIVLSLACILLAVPSSGLKNSKAHAINQLTLTSFGWLYYVL
jgi:hypothetical protein